MHEPQIRLSCTVLLAASYHKLGYRVLSYWLLLTSVEIIPSFTPTKPYSRDSETRHERGMLLVNMYAANPAHPAQYRNA